jgi:hypothetical protein
MQKKSKSRSGSSGHRVLIVLLLCAAAACSIFAGTSIAFLRPEAPAKVSHRTLTFEERVAYQRTIEEVSWRHRIWPKERPDPKPSLDGVMSQAQLEKKVADYLRNSQALEDYWQRPITAEQLQTEMNRMAQHTKQPEVLRELFQSLGNDPFVIAECLARPALAERLLTNWYAQDQTIPGVANEPLDLWLAIVEKQISNKMASTIADYRLPAISAVEDGCVDTWTPTNINNAPEARDDHTAVWTGSEMIIWGGANPFGLNTGGRYTPSTDSWVATSTTNAPTARALHTAVWTGNEMIVWGGSALNSGGRYNPATNSWTATSTFNAPEARLTHTAVWTGSEMIVWGGTNIFGLPLNTGGKYNPSTDTWVATSTVNAPVARTYHTAVWTGSEMIVWGGHDNLGPPPEYFNPVANTIRLQTVGRLPPSPMCRPHEPLTAQCGLAAR